MAGITQDQRMRAWNVHFIGGLRTVAGIYQRDDFLTVADVARELDMCLQYSQPPGVWQTTLLPLDTACVASRDAYSDTDTDTDTAQAPALTIDSEPFIILDQTDHRPFPTPALGFRTRYRLVFHATSCTDSRHSGLESTGTLCTRPTSQFSHPFPYTDTCIVEPGVPSRRRDPRYLPIGKKTTSDRYRLVQVGRGVKRKASSSASASGSSRRQSRAPSPSVATSELDTICSAEIPAEIMVVDQATGIMSKFRTNVLTGRPTCAVTGKGESWMGSSIIGGPGVEAAHIVPQCQWNTYPTKPGQGIADPEARLELEEAWRCTWASANGLPLLSHIHKCFEARLIAIHPVTRRIRIFAWYDLINDYHGQEAKLPLDIDPNALQHHWDMCCFENIIAPGIPHTAIEPSISTLPSSQSPISTSSTMAQALGNICPPTSSLQADRTATASLGQPSSGTKHNQRSLCEAVHPPSPPFSDPVEHESKWACDVTEDPLNAEQQLETEVCIGEEVRSAGEPVPSEQKWRVGNEIIEDLQQAERLRIRGWDVQQVQPAGSLVQPDKTWKVGDEVVSDPKLAERLRSKGWTVREVQGLEVQDTRSEQARFRKRLRSGPCWRVGAQLVEDEYEAQRLRDQGWVVERVDEGKSREDDQASIHRPTKKCRATALGIKTNACPD